MSVFTILNFGHVVAPLSSPLTFHNVKNHRRRNGQGTKNKGKERNNKEKKQDNRNKTTKKDTGSGTNNVVRVLTCRLGLLVFGCLGCSGVLVLMTFGKVKKVTREGAQKQPTFNMG